MSLYMCKPCLLAIQCGNQKKCDSIYALELRSIYEGVSAGYHMNKKHWNTMMLEETDVDDESIKEMIDHSYELVHKSLSKKKREALG